MFEWLRERDTPRLFNQSNCALYADHSLWVVPGSHRRDDTEEERALFPTRPVRRPALDGLRPAPWELAVLDYVREMPGAVQIHLESGDFCLYRNSLWHIGAYVPDRKRATLHDFVDTPEFAAFRARMADDMRRRRESGVAEWVWARSTAGSVGA